MEIIAQSPLKIVRMKKLLLISSLFFVSFCSSNDVFAQSDSVKVEYKQESIDSSSFFQRRKYKYLDIRLKDEKTLFKLGLEPLLIYEEHKLRINTHLVFEKKIRTEWSLIFEDVIEFSIDNMVNDYSNGVYNLIKRRSLTNAINFGTRYYYGMNKSIREKTSGNNFNSNYFEFTICSFPSFLRYKNTYSYPITQYTNEIYSQKGNLIDFDQVSTKISWGIQRRLSNFLFVDAKLYTKFLAIPGIGTADWKVGIDIIFGLGYNIKRK